jgi:PAS domain S-box-containing protein
MKLEPARKEQRFLEVFQEVTRLISIVRDPQQVMDLVVRRLPDLLEVDAATIRLLDHGTGKFVLGAASGVSDEYLARSTIDSAEVLARLLEGQPTVRTGVDQVSDHESSEAMILEGIQSIVSLPILFLQRVIGMLRLLCKENRDYSAGEIDFTMALAEQVGIALSNSRMFEELSSQVKFLRELREISRLVNSTLNLEQILSAIVEKLPSLMGVKGCTIRLLQPSTNRLELVAASGLSKGYLCRCPISSEDSIFKVLKGEPVIIYDATSDPRVDCYDAIREEGIRSILAIPIRNDREVLGVLRLLTEAPRIFSESEIDFAVTVAEEGGKAIQKAQTYSKITLLFNQIQEHERFLQTIMDSLWLQLLAVGPDKRVVMANRMFLEMNGLIEKEILGFDYYAVSPWAVKGRKNCPLDQVLESGAPVALLDSFEMENGTQWIERHLTPILGAEGKIECVIEVVRDVTDQKMLEQEKMERMKLEGIVEMAGTAAHELNTPLFAALGTAELLEDEITSADGKEGLAMIIRNLRLMGELTRKMTAVTGFESRQYVGDTQIVSLKNL